MTDPVAPEPEIDDPTVAVVNALYPNETLDEIPPIPNDIRVQTARRAIGAYLEATCPIPPAVHCTMCGGRGEVYDGPRITWKPCPMCVLPPAADQGGTDA